MTTPPTVLATVTHTFTQSDIDCFGQVSGGTGHIHTDPDYAAGTTFGRTLVQGLYLMALVMRAVTEGAPGAGQVSCRFVAPVGSGDELRVVVRDQQDGAPGVLHIEATVDGQSVAIGTAVDGANAAAGTADGAHAGAETPGEMR